MPFHEDVKGILEALLFTAAGAIPINRLLHYLKITRKELLEYLKELSLDYDGHHSGLRVVQVGDGVRLESRPEMAQHIEEFHHPTREFSLSPASLETLAIIAYKQPVTRGEIEAIRGVKVETPLYTLKRHNLIQEVGRKDTLGKPILYGTGQTFLEFFGLRSLEDLPSLEELGEEGGGAK